jgi:hypothetical protein
MSSIAEIVTGDATSLAVTLMKNSATFVIGGAAVIKAAIVSTDHTTVYLAAVTQSNVSPGTDLAHSLVIIKFTGLSTVGITYQGLAIIEIQVEEGGDAKTWFLPVRIIKGNIS